MVNLVLSGNSIKKQKYDIIGTYPESNREIIERDQIGTPNMQIHDRSFYWVSTGTSIKNGGVKLVLWTQNCFNIEHIFDKSGTYLCLFNYYTFIH